MKYIFKKYFLILISFTAFSQIPQKMSYQSVVRNTNGNLVANTLVSAKISALKKELAEKRIIDKQTLVNNGFIVLTD